MSFGIAGEELGARFDWTLGRDQAFRKHGRLGLAGKRSDFLPKEAKATPLSARGWHLPRSGETRVARYRIQTLSHRGLAGELRAKEEGEGVARFLRRALAYAPCYSRGAMGAWRRTSRTWESRGGPASGGFAAEALRSTRRTIASTTARARAGCLLWEPCAKPHRTAERARCIQRTFHGCSFGSAGGGPESSERRETSSDLIRRGREERKESQQEDRGDDPSECNRPEEEAGCGLQSSTSKQFYERRTGGFGGKKEEKEEGKKVKEGPKHKQWVRDEQFINRDATPAPAEVEEEAWLGVGDAADARDGCSGRIIGQRSSPRVSPCLDLRKDDGVLSDPGASSSTGQGEGSTRAGDFMPSHRPVAGGRHRADGRRAGRAVHRPRDRFNIGELEFGTVFGSGSKSHARGRPSSTTVIRPEAQQVGRASFGARFLCKQQRRRQLVERKSSRRSRCRKRKSEDREGQEQGKERKEGSLGREAQGDRGGLNARKLKRRKGPLGEEPGGKEASAGTKADGTVRLRGERETMKMGGELRLRERELGQAERPNADEFNACEKRASSARKADEMLEDLETGSMRLAKFKQLGELGATLARGLEKEVEVDGLKPFAELLAPDGATSPRVVFQQRWCLFPLPVDFKGSLHRSGTRIGDDGAAPWVQLAAMCLNRLSGVKGALPLERKSAQVREVMKNLEVRIGRFLKCKDPGDEIDALKLWEEVKSKKVSYEGEEVSQPLNLTYEQILLSVPPLGSGGSVPLAPLLVGRARFLLEHPEKCVLAMDERMEGPPKARVHIEGGHELKVWQLLEERGVIEWIDEKEVFRDAGGEYRAGMFGVAKSGKYDKEGRQVLRVIMNLKPINRVLSIIRGDIADLPTPMSWTQLVLSEGDLIEVSQADMSAAFYLFSLPPSWLRFMSFNCSYERSVVGLAGSGRVTPACRVLPMGWNSSVGLMQMASRQLLADQCRGEGSELRRTSLLPPWFVQRSLRDESQSWWQVYLDNFMAAEVIPKDKESRRASEELHTKAVEAWDTHGVLCAAEKHVRGSRDAVELGVNIQGEEGWLGGSMARMRKLLAVTLVLMEQKNPRPRWVQIVLGRWVFVLQFRRPAMSILNYSWRYIQAGQERRRLWPRVQSELAQLVCLAPLLQCDLRLDFSGIVTCSDASESGGAAAVSLGVTRAGMDLTRRLEHKRGGGIGSELLVISAFNGIGGAFRGYDLAGVQPVGLISIEIDPAARRVTRKAWPQVIEIGDVESVDKAMIRSWANLFPRVTDVHIYGGFPCVHLSAARAGRRNLEGEGSRLFWNLKQLIDDVEEIFGEFASVEFVVENVFSMDIEARDEISCVLQVHPLVLCPSDILPYNRPRLAWVSQEVMSGPGVTLERCSGFTRVWMSGEGVEDSQWIDEGWHRVRPGVPFATFMKSIPLVS